jgi:hypothetical protein
MSYLRGDVAPIHFHVRTVMDSSILPQIMKAARASEGYAVTQYKLYRTRKDGSDQAVTVEVLDAGPGEKNRFHVYARSDDGASATGNPADSLDVALAIVHWGNLG